MSVPQAAGWMISLDVPAEVVAVAVAALSDHSDAVAVHGDGGIEGESGSGPAGRLRVSGYCSSPPDPSALAVSLAVAAAAAGLPPLQPRIEPLPAHDWLADNRERFTPFCVGPFLLRQTDSTVRAGAGVCPITIDPGSAFGTGRHPSTAGCLLALAAMRRQPARALDIGTGSAILAIAAAKRWHRPVVASDIDRRAIVVAGDNAWCNGVAPLLTLVCADGIAAPLIRRHAPYDLVMANILARPLQRLARTLAPLCAGDLLLAGFIASDAAGVCRIYQDQGFRLQRRIVIDGWVTLWLRRPAVGRSH
jgi:ribosomal protein L11 methyltransferase